MPSSLQGLNVVYSPIRSSTDSTTHDLLTPPPGFPDFTAQLDLWTHLSFASDEPIADTTHRNEPDPIASDLQDKSLQLSDLDEADEMVQNTRHVIAPDKQTQTPIDLKNLPLSIDHQSGLHGPSFDLATLLAGFGIDPFLVPPRNPADPHFSSLSPLTESTLSPLSSPSVISPASISKPDGDALPSSKRSRNRKTSIVSQPSEIVPGAKQVGPAGAPAVAEYFDDQDPLTTPLTAAEDKRRRNTAASARFRAKKKEREQALERRSKELETRVNELERECEGLRRENGWLKGLVVGVTGSNASGASNSLKEEEAVSQEPNKKRRRVAVNGSLKS